MSGILYNLKMNLGRKLKAVCTGKGLRGRSFHTSRQSTSSIAEQVGSRDASLGPGETSRSMHRTVSGVGKTSGAVIVGGDAAVEASEPCSRTGTATEVEQAALLDRTEAHTPSDTSKQFDVAEEEQSQTFSPDREGSTVEEEGVVWITPAQAQDMRAQAYVTFGGEDESDYTKGPIRFVFASDGVEECCAVLMNLNLSGKIQEALRAQRYFDKDEREAERKVKALRNLLTEVNKHKCNLGFQLRRMKRAAERKETHPDSGVAPKSGDRANDLDPDLRALTQQMAVLDAMYEHHQDRVKALKSTIEAKKRWVLESNREAVAEMEEAWVDAQLMAPRDAPDESPVESLGLNEEYEKWCQRMQEDDDQVPCVAAPLDADPNARLHNMAPPMTEEQEQWERLKSIVYWSLERYQKAQHQFGSREVQRLAELQANLDAGARGEMTIDNSPEAFDIRWVKRNQELTRELIDAEAGWLEAKAAAAEAGLRVEMDDQSSDFGVDGDDGYRMSQEQSMIDSVPSPTIRNWVSGIPDLASPSFNDGFVESDSWDVQEVDISDSVSLVATGNDRRRIERWRKLCGL